MGTYLLLNHDKLQPRPIEYRDSDMGPHFAGVGDDRLGCDLAGTKEEGASNAVTVGATEGIATVVTAANLSIASRYV